MKKHFKMSVLLMMMIFMLQIPVFAAPKATMPKDQTIVDIAVGDERFSTLVTALKAAGLVDTLSGKGPFTVFAPTNDAFAKLPAGTIENLLKPENQAVLKDVLTYHVLNGKVLAQDAIKLNGQEIKMLNGKPVKVEVKGKDLYLNDAKVVVTDIVGKNGVIHVIDTVLMPLTK